MNKTPEIIYLIPGEDIEGYPGMVWCESSAPSDHCDPDEAVKYVRADIHESALKRQGNAAKMEFFKTIKELLEQNEKLQARVAELYDLIKCAQVESGVCMCGDDIKDHNQASGHSPVDVWDHAVEQINKEGRGG